LLSDLELAHHLLNGNKVDATTNEDVDETIARLKDLLLTKHLDVDCTWQKVTLERRQDLEGVIGILQVYCFVHEAENEVLFSSRLK